MSILEASLKLGLTPRAIRYRIKAGTIKAKKDRNGFWIVDGRSLKRG